LTDDNRSELDAVTEEVKQDLRGLFGKTGKLIEKLGNAVKKVVKKEESICEEIKIALKEEIAEGVISTRTIELHCPDEWKRRTKPKQCKNEKISFSKVEEKLQQQQIAATQDGKSVTYGEPEPCTENSQVDEIPLVGIQKSQQFEPTESKCPNCSELEEALREATSLSTADRLLSTKNNTSNEASEILKLEYSLPYQYVRQYMAVEYKEGKSNVWFSIEIDIKSKKVASARTGRISESKGN
jgi:hypothetical protein